MYNNWTSLCPNYSIIYLCFMVFCFLCFLGDCEFLIRHFHHYSRNPSSLWRSHFRLWRTIFNDSLLPTQEMLYFVIYFPTSLQQSRYCHLWRRRRRYCHHHWCCLSAESSILTVAWKQMGVETACGARISFTCVASKQKVEVLWYFFCGRPSHRCCRCHRSPWNNL